MPSCCFKRRIEELRRIVKPSPIIEGSGPIEHIKGAPDKVNEFYEKCRTESPDKGKEYCAKVAWAVYRKHINPKYKAKDEK